MLLPVVVKAGTFTIYGNIKGLDSLWLYINYYPDPRTDSVFVSKDLFTYTSTLTEPTLVSVYTNRPHFRAGCFVDSGTIFIVGDTSLPKLLLSNGNSTTNSFMAYQLSKLHIKQQQDSLVRAIPRMDTARQKEGWAKYTALYFEEEKLVRAFVSANPDNPVSAFLIFNTYVSEDKIQTADSLIKTLKGAAYNSHFTKRVIRIKETFEKIQPGKPAPYFALPDSSGNFIRLSEYKGKILLIDFWASWCGPCRSEHPKLVKLLSDYTNKGLEVLSISIDESREAWINAIIKDGLYWTNVHDSKAGENPIFDLYGARGVPTKFLINTDGTILAKNLWGSNLTDKLKELFP